MNTDERFDRNERLFGKEGQQAIRRAHVAVVGVGGLGTHVVQQLTLLGVGRLSLIDYEELAVTNRNRYIGAWYADPIPGSKKVVLGYRHALLIDPTVQGTPIAASLLSAAALETVKQADFVFGCLDKDGVRFVLNEVCLAYNKPLFDLASDVPEPGVYGGHVSIIMGDAGCLHCRDLLDPKDVRRFLTPGEVLENEDRVYGIDRTLLDEAGPSVVSINGVVASLGVTEFMVAATGLRPPCHHLEYRGDKGTVSRRTYQASADCYLCNGVRGQGDAAQIERYIAMADIAR